MNGPHEGQLLGGAVANHGHVYRVGDTVLRPVAPFRQATHSVLTHLEQQGFAGSPRLLTADERTESLTWIPGQAARSPLPEWALRPEALISIAQLVRRFHGAVASFDERDLRWPTPVPPAFRGSTVSHNDLHPGNIIFDGGKAVGLIDFDLAGPGGPIWDLATLLRCWAPLVDDVDLPSGLLGNDHVRMGRARLLLDAYGLSRAGRAAVVEALVANHDWTYRIVTDAVGAGHRGFGDYWIAVAAQTSRARDWLTDHLGELRAGLG